MASFRKRDSGRWQVQVRKKGYPTQTKSFRSKAAGARWVRSIEYEMDQGLFMSRNEAEATTVGELLNRYLQECTPQKKEVRAPRLAGYEPYCDTHWQSGSLHLFAVLTLRDIETNDFKR